MDSDSPEGIAEPSYANSFVPEGPKPVLVDASIQLDLSEEFGSDAELETVDVQSFPNGLDMKLPVTIQNCVPLNIQAPSELLVIANANNGTDLLHESKVPFVPLQAVDPNEALSKRICFDQNGQTYILAVQDGLTGVVEAANEGSPVVDASQQVASTEESGKPTSKQRINQNWFTSKAEKDTLHKKGHVWKQGMWSKEEIELLETNIRDYCEERDIDTPATIIFEMAKDERKDFYRSIAKGLNRPLFSVYRRVIRMYDNKNHVGKYTSEELEKLKQLRSLHGNNWQAIGNAMGRSASSIKDRCRLMKDNCNQGKWLPAEEKRLAEAVYELANTLPGEMISSGLSWADVADRVGTRSEKQCRTKWLNYLNWKEAGGTEWTREDDVALIYRVYTQNANDENQVDWNELAKGWMSARSPQWLRGKWWSLKRHVSNANAIPFQEVCECLYQQFVQKLQSSGKDISCSTQCISTDDSMAYQSAQQLLAQSEPTILHSLPTAAAPNGIVVTTVPISQECDSSVVPLQTAETIGLQNGVYPTLQLAPIMQTLEVLTQPTVHCPAMAQPFVTAAEPINPIIIQTAPIQTMQCCENLEVVGKEDPSSDILTPSSPLTCFASTQVPSVPPSPQSDCGSALDENHVFLEQGTETYESEVSQDSVLQGDDTLEHDEGICKSSPSHIILSDPMLTANHSPDHMVFEKTFMDQACGTDT